MEVRVANIRKEFDRFPALHEVSLDIRSGELIALLGPSGSGKTTLLRLIAGLEQPTEGKIYFGDEDASLRTVQERNVGFVFQSYALFKNMTVLDNVSFGLKVRPRATRPSRAEIRRRALELPDLVQLGGSRSASNQLGRTAPARRAGPRAGHRACCCSTSHARRAGAARGASGCARFTTAPATPPSSSRTTRRRR